MFCRSCFDELLLGDVGAACITPLTPLLGKDGATVWLLSGSASTPSLLSVPLVVFQFAFPLLLLDFFRRFLAPLDEAVLPCFSDVSSGVLGGASVMSAVSMVTLTWCCKSAVKMLLLDAALLESVHTQPLNGC